MVALQATQPEKIFHVCMLLSAFTSSFSTTSEQTWRLIPCSGLIQVGNNEASESYNVGTLMVETIFSGNKNRVMLKDVI